MEIKYKTSLRSINPLVMDEKCVIGLRSCKSIDNADGKVIFIKSKPITIDNILILSAIIKATI